MLELQRPDCLVERVVSAIRAEIDAGRLAAQSRLPTDFDAAAGADVAFHRANAEGNRQAAAACAEAHLRASAKRLQLELPPMN